MSAVQNEELEINLALKEIPVKIKNKETGEVEKYTLRELDGEGRDKYLNSVAARVTVGTDGKPGRIRNFNGIQAGLISLSLFDQNGANVPEPIIQKWPSSAQKQLHDKAKEISGLDEKAEEKAKND